MHSTFLRQAADKHPQDILPPYDTLVEQFGFDAVSAIVENLGGSTVYIPSMRTIFARCLEKEAVKEFRGGNYRQLIQKYGFSERHLRRVIHGR